MIRRSLILGALLLSFSVWLRATAVPVPPPAREALGSLPMQIADWRGRPEPPLEASVLKVLGADDYLNRSYVRADRRRIVGLYIGYHASQQQGSSIHSPMNCLPGAGWLPVEHGTMTISLPDGRQPVVNRVMIAKGDQKQVAIYWYQSQGRVVADEYTSKAYLFLDALRRGRTDAALVRIVVPVDDDPVAATESGRDFARTLMPLLDAFVPL